MLDLCRSVNYLLCCIGALRGCQMKDVCQSGYPAVSMTVCQVSTVIMVSFNFIDSICIVHVGLVVIVENSVVLCFKFRHVQQANINTK